MAWRIPIAACSCAVSVQLASSLSLSRPTDGNTRREASDATLDLDDAMCQNRTEDVMERMCLDDDSEHSSSRERPVFLPWMYTACAMSKMPPDTYSIRPPVWKYCRVLDGGENCDDPTSLVVHPNRGYHRGREPTCGGATPAQNMSLNVFWSVGESDSTMDRKIRDQLAMLDSSGLAVAAESVNMGVHDYYGTSWRNRFRSDFSGTYSWADKVKDIELPAESEQWWQETGERCENGIHHWTTPRPHHEFYVLEGLWEHCQQSQNPDSDAVLYLHTEGREGVPDDWPDMSGTNRGHVGRIQQHFLVSHYQDCVDHLKCGSSTCGPFLLGPDRYRFRWPHYSGNMWWARCDYIKSLPRPRANENEVRDYGHSPTLNPYLSDPPRGRKKAEWWLLGTDRQYSTTRHFKNCFGGNISLTSKKVGAKGVWECLIAWDHVSSKDLRC
ncbi:unnamed protein product [Prorocentrum cordatum]|uniref:Uncharacterized protein n=1 Tax=Prorocentrum cordatum TaxID=2364126 RepID=A0ABN9UCN3_9DINO|nr:unnamed protein product [Polarella glacialis]